MAGELRVQGGGALAAGQGHAGVAPRGREFAVADGEGDGERSMVCVLETAYANAMHVYWAETGFDLTFCAGTPFNWIKLAQSLIVNVNLDESIYVEN